MKIFRRDIIIILVSAVVIFLLIQATIQTSPVIGSSMEDSLLSEGQRLLISKIAYNFREPDRGGIIVFHPPFKSQDSTPYIKRIIGLPGEEIEINFNHKYIIDCFQSIDCDSVSLSFNGLNKPVVIKGIGDKTFTYLVMPMNR